MATVHDYTLGEAIGQANVRLSFLLSERVLIRPLIRLSSLGIQIPLGCLSNI